MNNTSKKSEILPEVSKFDQLIADIKIGEVSGISQIQDAFSNGQINNEERIKAITFYLFCQLNGRNRVNFEVEMRKINFSILFKILTRSKIKSDNTLKELIIDFFEEQKKLTKKEAKLLRQICNSQSHLQTQLEP